MEGEQVSRLNTSYVHSMFASPNATTCHELLMLPVDSWGS